MEIYLDNSATTRVMDCAVNAAVIAMREDYGNPSSLHKKGFDAEKLMEKAKEQLGKSLFCDKSEIVFTSGATESNNLGIIGLALANIRRGKRIVATAIEHPSVLEALKSLENQGFEVVYLMPDENNEYTPLDFFNAVDEATTLVCCMQVNNETGLVLPVLEIAKAVKRKNAKTAVFVDAVQGFLKLPLKLKTSSIDLMSISGHKVHAPKGIGALYIKRGVRIVPTMHGGGQQDKIRPGTESVPLIAAFGAAAEQQQQSIEKTALHYKCLKEHFLKSIDNISDISINSNGNYVDYIVSFGVKGIRSEVMLHFLEQFDIFVSSGSACAKGKQSHVLSALSIPKEMADNTLRISFCSDTTTQMLDMLVEKLAEGINTLAKKK